MCIGCLSTSNYYSRISSKRGFTLVELLVVMAIIAVLASMLVPVIRGVMDRARITHCLNNLRQIGTALLMYSSDYQDALPVARVEGGAEDEPVVDPMASLSLLYPNYVPDPRLFTCRGTDDCADDLMPGDVLLPRPDVGERTLSKRICSFGYDCDQTLRKGANPSVIAVAADAPATRDGVTVPTENCPAHNGKGQNVLYLDGHVEFRTTVQAGFRGDNIYSKDDAIDPQEDSHVRQLISNE
ncbi:MAG: prepilin-type N-terminal cleavage/methylation domain-containing protein [Planctomycetota bacterium]